MISKRTFVALILLITAGALPLRLVKLGERPMHCDEAVHTIKFDTLWKTGVYEYDLVDYHGPTPYYCALPAVWLSGADSLVDASEVTFRIVPVVFGVGLILLLLLIADDLGRRSAVCAALLTALAPAFVYFSRYYIQEVLLVFFTFLLLVAGWRYIRSRHAIWALLAGVTFGLMHATKETCIIAYGSMTAALLVTLWWRRGNGEAGRPLRAYLRPGVLIGAGVLAILVSVTFFSACFKTAAGPLDSIRAYVTYFERAGRGGIHEHPWHYYLHLLTYVRYAGTPIWTHGLILALAIVGGVAAVRGKPIGRANVWLLRFLVVYTILMTLIYSAISYKTPWCLLSFLHGMILLAGVGVVVLIHAVRKWYAQVAVGLVLLAATAQLGWQAWRTADYFAADNRNPYAYAHPVRDVLNLVEWVERVAALHQDGRSLTVKVIATDDDYWPLPWYLRGFSTVGFWGEVPANADAPVVIASEDLYPVLQERWPGDYMVSRYGLRPGTRLLVCVEQSLYDAFAATQPRSPGVVEEPTPE